MSPPISFKVKWWTCNMDRHLSKMQKFKPAPVNLTYFTSCQWYILREPFSYTAFKYRFFGKRWFALVHHYSRCKTTSWRKSFRFGATQHRHLQRHHSKIGGAQSRHDSVGRFQSRWHFNVRCMEIERLAKASRFRKWHQFRFFTIPFLNVATAEHRSNLMPRLDYWRARRLIR